MQALLTIGNLGKKVGLPAKTIRFYEDIGLIAKAQRSENGYRVYEEKAVAELSLIKRARDLGLPIPEIKKLMIGCTDGNCLHTKTYIEKEIAAYVDLLQKKIEELQGLQSKLASLHKKIQTDTTNSYCCNILEKIAEERG